VRSWVWLLVMAVMVSPSLARSTAALMVRAVVAWAYPKTMSRWNSSRKRVPIAPHMTTRSLDGLRRGLVLHNKHENPTELHELSSECLYIAQGAAIINKKDLPREPIPILDDVIIDL